MKERLTWVVALIFIKVCGFRTERVTCHKEWQCISEGSCLRETSLWEHETVGRKKCCFHTVT